MLTIFGIIVIGFHGQPFYYIKNYAIRFLPETITIVTEIRGEKLHVFYVKLYVSLYKATYILRYIYANIHTNKMTKCFLSSSIFILEECKPSFIYCTIIQTFFFRRAQSASTLNQTARSLSLILERSY